MGADERGVRGLRFQRSFPSLSPGGGALIDLTILDSVMVATLLLAHQLRGNLSGLFGESKLNHRCSRHVNR
jgi:hypothetical protein